MRDVVASTCQRLTFAVAELLEVPIPDEHDAMVNVERIIVEIDRLCKAVNPRLPTPVFKPQRK